MEIPKELRQKHCAHTQANMPRYFEVPWRVCYVDPNVAADDCEGCSEFDPIDKVALLVDLGKHESNSRD